MEKQSHLIVYERDDGRVVLLHDVVVNGQLRGMALSPDGRFLAGADGAGVILFDTAKLLSGNSGPIAISKDGPDAGSVYTAFSPNGHFLVVANERSGTLTLYDVSGLPSNLKLMSQIPVAIAPVGLAFSLDSRTLYSTSEVGPPSWKAVCLSEGSPHPEGVLLAIDVELATADPAKSMIGGVAAGCNPVRVALSPSGGSAYVTARGSNAVRIFDAEKMKGNPSTT
jgi:DNA-binding beta-propeller fold protein YncE